MAKTTKTQSYTVTFEAPAEWTGQATAAFVVQQLPNVSVKTIRRGGYGGEALAVPTAAFQTARHPVEP